MFINEQNPIFFAIGSRRVQSLLVSHTHMVSLNVCLATSRVHAWHTGCSTLASPSASPCEHLLRCGNQDAMVVLPLQPCHVFHGVVDPHAARTRRQAPWLKVYVQRSGTASKKEEGEESMRLVNNEGERSRRLESTLP